MTDSENPGADARRKYEDGAFMDAVHQRQPASTGEVADYVGCPRRTADYRLRRLRSQGLVNSKMVGNSLIWFHSEEGKIEEEGQ